MTHIVIIGGERKSIFYFQASCAKNKSSYKSNSASTSASPILSGAITTAAASQTTAGRTFPPLAFGMDQSNLSRHLRGESSNIAVAASAASSTTVNSPKRGMQAQKQLGGYAAPNFNSPNASIDRKVRRLRV